jgi:hypothetical protein
MRTHITFNGQIPTAVAALITIMKIGITFTRLQRGSGTMRTHITTPLQLYLYLFFRIYIFLVEYNVHMRTYNRLYIPSKNFCVTIFENKICGTFGS